eukprot:3941384-Rhodomonas_salina.8
MCGTELAYAATRCAHHTLAQYGTSHSTIRLLITGHRIAPYASSASLLRACYAMPGTDMARLLPGPGVVPRQL